MDKIKIKVDIENYNELFMEGEIDLVINNLKNKKEELIENGFENIQIELKYYNDAPTDFIITGYRLESDSEYKERIKILEEKNKSELKKIEREKKLFEKLKQKYDNN